MPSKKQIPASFSESVKKYVQAQCSTIDLANEYSVAKATVLKWMDELGVPRHSSGVMISVKKVGKPGVRLGATHTDEAKQRMSAARKGRVFRPAGYSHSEETKKKIGEARRLHWASVARPEKPVRTPKQKVLTTPKSPKSAQSAKKMNPAVRVQVERMSDAEAALRRKCRSDCKRMLRRVLYMPRKRDDVRMAEHVLGYTKIELKKYLEAQFKPGMSWSNRDSFHIDHIKPYAQFFAEGIYDPIKINALTNLQVLTPEENRKKGTTFVSQDYVA